ncbi:MAG TPA: hypothetical protein VGB55_02950 [Tepidisphaeraceae bacterium]|jgi:hypothetical protein
MNKHWTSKIVIAGVTVALGLPMTATTFAERQDRSERRNNDEEPKIVKEARIVREGKGEELEYKAPEDGQVWLYDATNKEVLHSMSIRSGQTYGVNPKNDYVVVNGKEGEGVKVDPDNKYRIYFVTEEERDEKNSKNRRDDSSRSTSSKIPDSATVVAEGRDEDLSVKADDDVKVYIQDKGNNQVVETFTLERGQRLTISPRDNAMTIDGKSASKTDLSRKVQYRIYFDKR